MHVIYRWTRTHYSRANTGAKYTADGDKSVSFVTGSKMLDLTGESERSFFASIGARFVVRRGYAGVVLLDNYRPDRLAKCRERFEPIDISEAVCSAGFREREALNLAEALGTPMQLVQTAGGHEVARIGRGECAALLDLSNMRWVG